ncbi:hypothetical protein B9J78_05295 [bacterium Unc6]|nr:hypothetical protein [bacterium Unc6]
MEWKNWEAKNYSIYIWNDFIRFAFDLREGIWGCAIEKKKENGIFACQSGLRIYKDNSPKDFLTSLEYRRGWIQPEDITDSMGKCISLNILHEGNSLPSFIFQVTVYESLPFVFIKLKSSVEGSFDFLPLCFSCKKFEGPIFGKGKLFVFSDSKVVSLSEIDKKEISLSDIVAISDADSNVGSVIGWTGIGTGTDKILMQKIDKNVNIESVSRPMENDKKHSQTVFVGVFENILQGMEMYANFISKRKLHLKRIIPVGWSGRDLPVENINEDNIIQYAKKIRQVIPIMYVQVDHWWKKQTGDWEPNQERFPQGMKHLTDTLKAEGFIPCLWFSPFCVSKSTSTAQEHPEWLLKDENQNNIEKDGIFVLDITNPDVKEWIKKLIEKITNEWGFDSLRLDLLDYEAIEAKRFDNGILPVISYLEGMSFIRSLAPQQLYIAACGILKGPSIVFEKNIFDSAIIGHPLRFKWNEIKEQLKQNILNWYLHQRVWINEASFLKTNNVDLNENEIKFLVTVSGMLSNSIFIADTETDKLNLIKGLFPILGICARPLDMFEGHMPSLLDIFLSAGWEDYHVVAALNWDDEPKQIQIDFSKIGLKENSFYMVFEYWDGRFLGTHSNSISLLLEPHCSKILSIRPSLDVPQFIGTTRHILQGFVDVEAIETKEDSISIKLTGEADIEGKIYVFVPSCYVIKNSQPFGGQTDNVEINPVENGNIVCWKLPQEVKEIRLEFEKVKNTGKTESTI